MTLEDASKKFDIMSSLVAAIALIWNVHVFQETSKTNAEVLRSTAAQQQESAAVDLHNSYLGFAFQNSGYVFDKQNVAKLSSEEYQRYTLFAINTVRTAERLFVLTQGQPLWRRSIDDMLSNHLEFIPINYSCSDFDPEFGKYLKARIDNLSCK